MVTPLDALDLVDPAHLTAQLRDAMVNDPGVTTEDHPSTASVQPLDDLAATRWVQAYDAAWLGRRWERLSQYLAPDVLFVNHGRAEMLQGRPAVISHLRNMSRRATMHHYSATDLKGFGWGNLALIIYCWRLDGAKRREHQHIAIAGRDVLVLRTAQGSWQLACRFQNACSPPRDVLSDGAVIAF
jgi:ketosteroid isomerase-like protein